MHIRRSDFVILLPSKRCNILIIHLSGKIGTKGWGDDGMIETLGVNCIYAKSNLEGRVNAQSVFQLVKYDPTLETMRPLCKYMPRCVIGLFI